MRVLFQNHLLVLYDFYCFLLFFFIVFIEENPELCICEGLYMSVCVFVSVFICLCVYL